MKSWSVDGVDDRSCRVEDATGQHVGNLNWIRGVWKFKAIGHDASGAVIPGGGPLTESRLPRASAVSQASSSGNLEAPNSSWRCATADPKEPEAVFSASDRSTSRLDLRSRRRESQ